MEPIMEVTKEKNACTSTFLLQTYRNFLIRNTIPSIYAFGKMFFLGETTFTSTYWSSIKLISWNYFYLAANETCFFKA